MGVKLHLGGARCAVGRTLGALAVARSIHAYRGGP